MKTYTTKKAVIAYSEIADKFNLPKFYQNIKFNFNNNSLEITFMMQEDKE